MELFFSTGDILVLKSSTDAFFEVQDQAKGAVSIEIISMKSFTTQEPKALVEPHGRYIRDFCLERYLPGR